MNIFDYTRQYFAGICRKSKKSTNTDDSISSLINIPLTQSQSIRLGTHVEKLLRDFIASYDHIENVRPKNEKGRSERDHLFYMKDGDRKIYAELKCNLNLDSEKRVVTCEKVRKISEEEACGDSYLLALRYINDVPDRIIKQYEGVTVISVSDYFRRFGIQCPFGGSEVNYKLWLNQMARELVYLDDDLESRIAKLENDISELKRLKRLKV